MSENPYTKPVEELHINMNSPNQRYIEGKRIGWNDGVTRYFNMDSENDCADTLYIYLSRLYDEADRRFGHGSPILSKIKNMILELDTLGLPTDHLPWPTFADLQHLDNEVEEDENWLQPFERQVECNA